MSSAEKVSLVGVGKMGEAFLVGLLKSGYDASLLMVCDSDEERVKVVVGKHHVKHAKSVSEATSWGDVIIIAVKPKDFDNVLSQMAGFTRGKVIVSFAAGVSIDYIYKVLRDAVPVIRAMPNLACKVRQGLIAVSKSALTPEEAYRKAIGVLRRTGEVCEVEEVAIDVATGLTGSGPAYVCYFIESLKYAGSKLGLEENLSVKMALQLLYGTSKLLLEEGISPEGLREMVATPGGTTAKGLEVLAECGFRECVARAVEAATRRAREIAREIENA